MFQVISGRRPIAIFYYYKIREENERGQKSPKGSFNTLPLSETAQVDSYSQEFVHLPESLQPRETDTRAKNKNAT